MRRPLIGLAVLLGMSLFAPTGSAFAQTLGTGFNDPFNLYFGWYLPQQAALAAQPRVNDTLNALTAARQFQAVTDRAGLYDPISPFGEEEYDPLHPYASRGGERRARAPGFATGGTMGTGRGGYSAGTNLGPAGIYFERSMRYFPTLRVQPRGPNRQLAVTRRGGFSSGGMGGGIPGMPGPR